jgi:hypothetical protein
VKASDVAGATTALFTGAVIATAGGAFATIMIAAEVETEPELSVARAVTV